LSAFTISVHVTGTDWAAWVAAGATVLTALILGASAFLAYFGLRDAKRTRHGQLITAIWARYDDPRVRASRRLSSAYGSQRIVDLIDRLLSDNPTVADAVLYEQFSRWPSLIEMLGVLYDEQALDLDVIARAWGIHIVDAWQVWQAPARRLRDRRGSPIVFAYFEQLADKLAAMPNETMGRTTEADQAADET